MRRVYDTTVAAIGFSLPPEGTTKIKFMIGAQDATSSLHPEIRTWDFADYMLLVATTNQGATDAAGQTSVQVTCSRWRFSEASLLCKYWRLPILRNDTIDFQVGRKADGGMLLATADDP